MKLWNRQIIVWSLAGIFMAGLALGLSKEGVRLAPLLPTAAVSFVIAEEDSATDYTGVEKILNASGQMKEDAFVVKFPRSDLK